jgi:glycogen operon protein
MDLGVFQTNTGVIAAIRTGHVAEEVLFCHLKDGAEIRTLLDRNTDGVWRGEVPDVKAGDPYFYRVEGPWDPPHGHFYNSANRLLDPYARGHLWVPDGPVGVVIDDTFDWGNDAPPSIPWRDTVIGEAHVIGLTKLHPDVPEHLRGTYAGIAHLAPYLNCLGITALELLPVHSSQTEQSLVESGRSNYWGYSTLGFFAPNPSYASETDPQQVIREFKQMVKDLHAAGIEVILDVVFNHTCEGGPNGPIYSWRGLDGHYYRMDDYGNYVVTTGCGNNLDTTNPIVIQMILDSLRYWVEIIHVDGYRYDLAAALARNRSMNFDPNHPLLTAIRIDPVLSQVKHIAEPWDCRDDDQVHTGQFPPGWAEWNGWYRDDARRFWLLNQIARRVLAIRLAGSRDPFDGHNPHDHPSLNFVTAHDGFTLSDLGAYNKKHNEANGEGGRDGEGNNNSWNHGAEGHTEDPEINASRLRSVRNLLTTLLLSAGVPMLVIGDEIGRTQHGNNNAYCHNNKISWIPWENLEPWQLELQQFVKAVLDIRHSHPEVNGECDIRWCDQDGTDVDWNNPWAYVLQMLLVSPGGNDGLLVVVNGAPTGIHMNLPEIEPKGGRFRKLLDTREDVPNPHNTGIEPGADFDIAPRTIQVYDYTNWT